MIQKFVNKYKCRCNICGHQWWSRNDKEPWKCPSIDCQSFKWNKGEPDPFPHLKGIDVYKPNILREVDFTKLTKEEMNELARRLKVKDEELERQQQSHPIKEELPTPEVLEMVKKYEKEDQERQRLEQQSRPKIEKIIEQPIVAKLPIVEDDNRKLLEEQRLEKRKHLMEESRILRKEAEEEL